VGFAAYAWDGTDAAMVVVVRQAMRDRLLDIRSGRREIISGDIYEDEVDDSGSISVSLGDDDDGGTGAGFLSVETEYDLVLTGNRLL